MKPKVKTQKTPKGIQQNPKKSLDQKLTPKISHADLVALNSFRKRLCYNTKKNIGNWTLVFVYSSYHLNISFPSSGSYFNNARAGARDTQERFCFISNITNSKNNNHASIDYDASVETLSTVYISISFFSNYWGYTVLMKNSITSLFCKYMFFICRTMQPGH